MSMKSFRETILPDDIIGGAVANATHKQRVVALSSTAQDAKLCAQVLEQNGIAVCCCDSIDAFSRAIFDGAGIAMVAEEYLDDAAIAGLKRTLAGQPKWSELPILVLLQTGKIAASKLQRILSLEHVTLINRPLLIAVFVSTVRAKLRDRMRQFEVRDLLLAKDHDQQMLRREARRLDMALQAGGMAAWEWSNSEMYWSDAIRRLHGFDEKTEPTESAMFTSIVEADRQRIVQQWSEAISRDNSFRSEFRIDHPQLGERWLAAVAEPFRAQSGKTIRYAGLQWDVTDRKQSELELHQSHETFKRLIDDNPQGLYVIDSDMRMCYASKGARETLANVIPLIGRPFREVMESIWPLEFAEVAVTRFRHTLETGEAYNAPPLVEHRVDLDTTEAYDWSIERIVLPGNRFGVVCHYYNNTERQQSVDILRQSEQYFRDIANASPAMLWVTDDNHMCTFLSKRWYETTGQTEEEGMGIGWTFATHPDDQPRAAKEFLDAANNHKPFWSEFRLRMADGSYRWAVDVGYPRFDSDDGTFIGYTGYVIDVNDRKAFEESLKLAKEVAENANRSRGEFLANMSHEIRTPMAAILGHAEILRDHLKDPDNIQVVETIRRNGNFLLGIINDILDLSKIDAGMMEVDRKPVRPDAIVAEIRSLMDVRASEKQISLGIEFAGPIPETIESDAVRLRQILVNLVGNAIKFTDAGEVRIKVGYDSGTAKLSFEVIDTGIGIDPSQFTSLFEPFVQADSTSTRAFGGTGLGLAICRRLAQALGGEVTVESTPRRGSKFMLSIGAQSPGELVEPNLSVDIKAESYNEDIRLSASVLVVDDRRDIRYLAQHFIERAGGTVLTATNGQEAVDFISDSNSPHVDVIVMDMQMPVMDGYDATRELRRRGYKVPIIALTANAMKSDRDECMAAGCSDYTTKPLDSGRLIAMIDRVVRVS